MTMPSSAVLDPFAAPPGGPDEDLTADEYYTADDPEEPPGPPPPPAADTEPAPSEEAPYGWTRDRATKQWRPKKLPGRPGPPKQPPPDAEALRAGPAPDKPADKPPGPRKHIHGTKPPGPEVPMPEGGFIAKGINKLYRRAGKILRAMDHDLGTALIECTKPDPEDDSWLTVGEAWENICKVNPRIRRFAMTLLSGGAWADLVMAHAPFFLALAMKPAIMRFLPFRKLIESYMAPDDDTEPGNLRPADAEEMMAQAEAMARKAAGRMNLGKVDASVMKQARQVAEDMAGGRVPPGFRQQPKRQTRASRKKAST